MKPMNTLAAPLSAAQLSAAFQQAVALHQKGQLAQAKGLYERILSVQPRHYQSLHLLGLVAAQTGDFQRAADTIGQAIALFPNNPDFHTNRGNALRALGQHQAALVCYDAAIALQGKNAAAHANRAVTLLEMGQWQAAVASCDAALALVPQDADTHFSRGVGLHALGLLDAAAASYAKAAALRPSHAHAHFNHGNVMLELQQWAQALASYDRALASRLAHAQLHFHRAYALQMLERMQDALSSYDQAIAVQPDYAEAYCNRGLVLNALEQWQAAVASQDQAIGLRADYAEAYSNRGVALQALRQLPAAIASFDQAIAAKPDYAKAYSNRGMAQHESQQLEAAIASYDQAIAIQPDYAEAYSHRGLALHALGQLDAAVASYDQAIALRPDYGQALFNKSLSLLLAGDLAAGWPLYEWRWEDEKSKARKRHFAQPLWLGHSSLQGKTLLLHSEQGFGDTIQFCRYAAVVAAFGARVVLEVPKPLMPLMAHLDGVATLVESGTALPAFDLHCPLLSLPLACQTRLDNVPGVLPYLQADATRLQQWADRLGPASKPRIGIVWSGSAAHSNDANRSIPLAKWLPQLPDTVEVVSLQKELRASDQDTLAQHSQVRHFGDDLQDFGDTAALCALMDAVVCVDTSVAHLSAALGKPTWVLLPLVPDWRWLMQRDDSPWYASMTLYRQTTRGGWDAVLSRVASDLQQLPLAAHPPGGSAAQQ